MNKLEFAYQTIAKLEATVSERSATIENLASKVVDYEAALKQIAQMTGNGDYLNDMVNMKRIASDAITAITPDILGHNVSDCFGKKKGCEYPDCDCRGSEGDLRNIPGLKKYMKPKIKVDDTGLNGQAVNPYSPENYIDGFWVVNFNYIDFAKENPSYPLAAPSTPNQIVDAVLVWQYLTGVTEFEQNWINVNSEMYKTFNNDFNHLSVYRAGGGILTRQAFEAIANKEETQIKELK